MPLMSEQGRLGMWVHSNICEIYEIIENGEPSEMSDLSGASEPSGTSQVDDQSKGSRLCFAQKLIQIMLYGLNSFRSGDKVGCLVPVAAHCNIKSLLLDLQQACKPQKWSRDASIYKMKIIFMYLQ